jgi:hypothetical protein
VTATNNPIAERAVALAPRRDATAVDELVRLAGGERRPLEDAAQVFIARLHRRSDDYEATNALRLVHRALDAVGWDAMAPQPQPLRPHLFERITHPRHTSRQPAPARRVREPAAA